MANEMHVPNIKLNNGVEMPQLGFGVWQIVPDDRAAAMVGVAFEAGYRAVDTAKIYTNEGGVGAAIAASGLRRDEIFVTTKLWNNQQGYETTLAAFDQSLGKLGLDYVDLYLVHWPAPIRDHYLETWRAFERLYADNRVRAIGVSNFEPHHLRRLLDSSDVVPAVNQIEFHPYLQQHELFELHKDWYRDRGVEPSRARRAPAQGCRDRRDRREGQTLSGAGDPALAYPAREYCGAQVRDRIPHPGELCAIRLRTERRGHGGHQRDPPWR